MDQTSFEANMNLKKRTYKQFFAEDMKGKLRSKDDIYFYFDKICKYTLFYQTF